MVYSEASGGWSFPQIISCTFIVYWFLFSFYRKTAITDNSTQQNLEEIILHGHFDLFAYFTPPYSGSYNIYFKGTFFKWKGRSVNVSISFCEQIFQGIKGIVEHKYSYIYILILWRVSSLVAAWDPGFKTGSLRTKSKF